MTMIKLETAPLSPENPVMPPAPFCHAQSSSPTTRLRSASWRRSWRTKWCTRCYANTVTRPRSPTCALWLTSARRSPVQVGCFPTRRMVILVPVWCSLHGVFFRFLKKFNLQWSEEKKQTQVVNWRSQEKRCPLIPFNFKGLTPKTFYISGTVAAPSF